MAHETIERYAELSTMIKVAEAEGKRLRKVRGELEEAVLDLFSQFGVKSMTTTDGKTVHLHVQVWANAFLDENGERNYAAACEALANAGYGEFVTTKFHVGQVSSLIRELDAKSEIPEEFLDTIEIKERITVKVRGA